MNPRDELQPLPEYEPPTRGTIDVILVGGPADGDVLIVSELSDRLRVPVHDDNWLEREMQTAVYDLATDDAMGRPSRDDQGRYRYRYHRTDCQE